MKTPLCHNHIVKLQHNRPIPSPILVLRSKWTAPSENEKLKVFQEVYFKIDGTSWVVISAGRACSAYLGLDAPLGGIHHWGKAGSGHVHCPLSRHLSTDYVDNDDDLHNSVRQARSLAVDMFRHLFTNLFWILTQTGRNPNTNLFGSLCCVDILGLAFLDKISPFPE